MFMLIWPYGIVLLAAAFGMHVLLWRMCLPRKHTDTLLFVFFSVLAAGVFVIKVFGVLPLGARGSVFDYLRLVLFYVSVTLAYVISYSALEADSPSLLMTLEINAAGSQGLEKSKLFNAMTDDVLIRPRLDDLVRDGLASLEQGKYCLTVKGRSFVRIFIFFRTLLGAPKGG